MQGLFHLNEQTYRNAPGVSQSVLKPLMKSAAHCQQAMDEERRPTKAMLTGTAMHTLLLEPDSFGIGKSHWIRPNTYTSTRMVCPVCNSESPKAKSCQKCGVLRQEQETELAWNMQSNTCKDWIAEKLSIKKLPVFSEEEMENVTGMVYATKEHEHAKYLFDGTSSEVAAFYLDPETGLLLKARVDKICDNFLGCGPVICDAKKCQDAQMWGVKDFYDLGAAIQAASNTEICRKLGLDVQTFYFMAIEEKAPHGIQIWDADSIMDYGSRWYHWLLRRFAECWDTDTWPGYAPGVKRLELPKYAKQPPFDL